MNKLSLIITLIGLFTLILILNLSNPIKITSQEQLSKLNENQKVEIKGKVISQKENNQNTILILDNNLTLIYSGSYFNFKDKKVEVIGTYNSFKYNKIRVLKIEIQKN